MANLSGISDSGEVILHLKEADIEKLKNICENVGSSSAPATIIYLIRQYEKKLK